MILSKGWMRWSLAIGAAALLAGCGTTQATSPPTSTSSTSTSTQPSTSSNTALTVTTNSATVSGKSETVLATSNGMTLYYFTGDTPTTSNCTGSCSQIWPALTVSGTSVTGTSNLPGSLTVVKDGNGHQVAYQGHLLYTYSGDSAPHQANGEGIEGKWFVATPQLTTATSTTSSSSSSSNYGGY